MRIKSLELRAYLSEAGSDNSLERAYADGKVEILQNSPGRTRTGASDHAEYYAAEDKIILRGGSPVFSDSLKGNTRGAELTYYAADDRLLFVDGVPSSMPPAAFVESRYWMVTKLETHELCKAYRGRKVVDDVSVFVEQGEVVGVLGPNGAGKTTSFYMIVGLISPDSGTVLLDGKDITPLAMYQRARRGISYLPQEASVFRKLSVEDNLLAILETLPIDARERRERLALLIEQLGLQQVRHSKG